MSKSILVIDTPIQVCQKCKLCYECEDNDYMCAAEGKIIPDGEKPDWCPIRDLPEKKEEKQYLTRKDNRGNTETYGETRDMIAVGWNACIDEILKETN